jgi:hypothetical protein
MKNERMNDFTQSEVECDVLSGVEGSEVEGGALSEVEGHYIIFPCLCVRICRSSIHYSIIPLFV